MDIEIVLAENILFLVNGICIGLAGKLNVLGRATKISDFILVGKDKVRLLINFHD